MNWPDTNETFYNESWQRTAFNALMSHEMTIGLEGGDVLSLFGYPSHPIWSSPSKDLMPFSSCPLCSRLPFCVTVPIPSNTPVLLSGFDYLQPSTPLPVSMSVCLILQPTKVQHSALCLVIFTSVSLTQFKDTGLQEPLLSVYSGSYTGYL